MLPTIEEAMAPFEGYSQEQIRALASKAGLAFWPVYRTVKHLNRRPSYEVVSRIVNASGVNVLPTAVAKPDAPPSSGDGVPPVVFLPTGDFIP